jgi:hypothetical protein
LADFLVAEGVVDDISHEGLRVLLHQEGVSVQVIKTRKQSTDPDFETKKNRILHLYGLMDGTDDVQDDDPDVVISMDEFGPLNLQPHPGRQWAARGGGGVRPRRRRRSTYTRPHEVRHLLAAYDLSRPAVRAHQAPQAARGVPRLLPLPAHAVPPGVRMGVVLDNFSPHLSTRTDRRVADWAAATTSNSPTCPPTRPG